MEYSIEKSIIKEIHSRDFCLFACTRRPALSTLKPTSLVPPTKSTIMHIFALLPLCAGIAYALPQDNCETTTVQVIEPTTTATYTSTAVVTVRPSTAQDLGTFTLVSTIKSTKTHFTLTTSSTECQSSATA